MKRQLLYLALIAIFASGAVSCVSDTGPVNPKETEKKVLEVSPTEYNLAMQDFAVVVNEAINNNPSFRNLVRKEALKMFDGDYDVLIRHIIDKPVAYAETADFSDAPNRAKKSNYTVRTLLEDSYYVAAQKSSMAGTRADNGQTAARRMSANTINRVKSSGGAASLIEELTTMYPDLQVAVPFADEVLESLEDSAYIPPVTFIAEEYSAEYEAGRAELVPAFYGNEVIFINGRERPDSAVIVIGPNERGEPLNSNMSDSIPAPVNLRATQIVGGISLRWDMPTITFPKGIGGYKIYRKSQSEDSYTPIATRINFSNREYADVIPYVEPQIEYNYYVCAFYQNIESLESNHVSCIAPNRPLPTGILDFSVERTETNILYFHWDMNEASGNDGIYRISRRIEGELPIYVPYREYNYSTNPIMGHDDWDIIEPNLMGKKIWYKMEHITSYGVSNARYDYIQITERDPSKVSDVYLTKIRYDERIEGWLAGFPEFGIEGICVDYATKQTYEVAKGIVINLNSRGTVISAHKREYNVGIRLAQFDSKIWYGRMCFYVVEYDPSARMLEVQLSATTNTKPSESKENPNSWLTSTTGTSSIKWSFAENSDKMGFINLDFFDPIICYKDAQHQYNVGFYFSNKK